MRYRGGQLNFEQAGLSRRRASAEFFDLDAFEARGLGIANFRILPCEISFGWCTWMLLTRHVLRVPQLEDRKWQR
jgi:hypothetical protein